MLSVRSLKKIFYPNFIGRMKGATPFTAVNNISFDVNRGEIVGILGPNGAGKTTTMQMLLGTLKQTSGTITYFGKNFLKHRSEVMEEIGFASTYIHLPERLTVEENLEVFGRLYRLGTKERKKAINAMIAQFGMEPHRKKQVGQLSAGQVTRTMLAKAFLSNPKMVLLDEPTAALDPDVAQDLRSFILSQKEEHGTTILLASHNMDEVTHMCDRVLVLQNGEIIDQGTPDNLAARIKQCRLSLLVENLEKVEQLAKEMNLIHCIEGKYITIELEENQIASFLQTIAQNAIEFSQIYIEQPTLEDYFIEIARGGRS